MSELIPKSAEIPDSDYVVVGGTGDLALRKIFPALFWRYLAGQITTEFRCSFSYSLNLNGDFKFGPRAPTACRADPWCRLKRIK